MNKQRLKSSCFQNVVGECGRWRPVKSLCRRLELAGNIWSAMEVYPEWPSPMVMRLSVWLGSTSHSRWNIFPIAYGTRGGTLPSQRTPCLWMTNDASFPACDGGRHHPGGAAASGGSVAPSLSWWYQRPVRGQCHLTIDAPEECVRRAQHQRLKAQHLRPGQRLLQEHL
ncbi:hypothetical protein E2C01_088825 [Portunus trituberculatus]|uniref:Uncharacterized protein n=1 Tax=Portunus trituberculatus TaxID=210409 RepID=A0A5B7JGH8_PORTR|nr:hypothetical protein [Portunus trituberculatus]